MVRYARPHALMSVKDLGHRGALKHGWAACAWARASARLALAPLDIPQGHKSQAPGYAWCAANANVSGSVLHTPEQARWRLPFQWPPEPG